MTALKRWLTSSENAMPSVLLAVLLALLLKPKSIFLTLTDGRMPGNDDYVRLAQVRDWMGGAGWFDVEQTHLGANGIVMHWSRIIDPFVAAIIRLGEPLFGIEMAERVAAIVWPMLLFAMTIWVTIAISRRIAPTLHPALVGVIGGLSGSAAMQFEPGRIDHHNVQVLLMMLVVLGGVDRRLRRGGIVAGLACAASMMIGMESLVLIGLFGLIFAVRWIAGDDSNGTRFQAFGAAFALGIFGVYGVGTPPAQYFSTVCDQLSLAYGVPGMVAGIATFAATSIRLNGQTARIVACFGIGALSIGTLTFVAPECLRGPYAALSEEAATRWLPLVSEAQGLVASLSATPGYVLGFVIVPLLTILAGALIMKSAEPKLRWDWAMLLVPVIFTFGLSFVQVRQGQFIGVMSILLLAGALPLIRYHLSNMTFLQGARAQLAIGTMLFGLSATAMTMFLFGGTDSAKSASEAILATDSVTVPRESLEGDCLTGSAMARLAELPVGRILNPHKLSGRLLTATPHTVLVGPYHRDDRAVLDGMVLIERSAAEVRQVVEDRRVDYVVVCLQAESVAFAMRRGPEGFIPSLVRDGAPDWLREQFVDSGLAVYSVK